MAHPLRSILFGGLIVATVAISGWYIWTNMTDTQHVATVQTAVHGAGPATETPQAAAADKKYDYSFKNKKMFVTYDKGTQWQQVPAEMEEFFGGEYETAAQNQLLADSFKITLEKTGFLIVKSDTTLSWLESTDAGKKWQEYPILSPTAGVRFRKIQFFDNGFAAVFASGGRVMSQEGCSVAVSHDDGHTWQKMAADGLELGSLVTAATFVDENQAFVSRKTQLLVSKDGGQHFSEAKLNVPEQYEKIFLWPEAPTKEADGTLSVLVNQGDLGDYRGGQVKGRFESKDGGYTFDFVAEVEQQTEVVPG